MMLRQTLHGTHTAGVGAKQQPYKPRLAVVTQSACSKSYDSSMSTASSALRPAASALAAATVFAASALVGAAAPAGAVAAEAPARGAALIAAQQLQQGGAESGAAAPAGTVYFGNGCFWGRQKDFVETERALGRTAPDAISSVVGYAGGARAGPGGRVCYYYADPRTIYERLGHAEVVSVALTPGGDEAAREAEFRAFADTYFKQFQRLRNGKWQRLDPQDIGAGYRNVVGIPGGVDGPLFKVLQAANVNGMELRRAADAPDAGGGGRERDEVGVVWVHDSAAAPFYRAERYHQFHPGLGLEAFPASYTRDLKAAVASTGRIDPTGCPELPF